MSSRHRLAPLTRRLLRIAALCTALGASLCAALPAMAADAYRVDMIVFVDTWAATESPRPVRPVAANGISLLDTAALKAAGIRVLPDSAFGLDNEWQHLRNARRFHPLLRLAWTQPASAHGNAPALRLRQGQPLAVTDFDTRSSYTVTPVDGTVRLSVNRYLHLDVDMMYTEAGNGSYVQYPLREDRRMRSGELHHLDSTRLGILARVTPLK